MRRTSLLLGALLLSGRTVAAQAPAEPSTPSFRTPATQVFGPPGGAPQQPGQPQAHPAPAAPAPVELHEDLTSFDGSHASLLWQDRTWKVIANGVPIKDFGRRESDARQAQRIMQDLHLTQHGTIGSPAPIMEYWLSDGHAPIGLASAMRPVAIDTASLKVEQDHADWVVRDRHRVWFNFGPRGDQAGQALAVLQKYGFTQVAILGSPAPTMMLFLGNPVRPGSGTVTFRAPSSQANDQAPTQSGSAPLALAPLQPAPSPFDRPKQAFGQGPIDHLPNYPTMMAHPATVEAAGMADRTTFDWRQAQVKQVQGHWQLTAGSYVMGDFGSNQHAAAEALKAVQYYHCTEQCHVGQPTPYCSYFLASGQAPRGVPFGVQGQPIDVAHLAVEQVGDKYALVSNGQPVLQFGQRPDEARHMLNVIQRQKFDFVCHFGGPAEQGMMMLVQARWRQPPALLTSRILLSRTSASNRFTNSATLIAPRSPSTRSRTATFPAVCSLSPTTSMYGIFSSCPSRIL
jgi:hypothetical protein